jgi:hypothetical protein
VTVTIDRRVPVADASVARSLHELVGFRVQIGLQDLANLETAEFFKFGYSINIGLGKGNSFGVNLLHGVLLCVATPEYATSFLWPRLA